MTRPRLLDLFCGAGGCSAGYHRAGFDVVGVDLDPLHGRRYPFEFHAADALEFLAEHGHGFDVIAASPPCQAYSVTRYTHTRTHPDLVGPVRAALRATGKPYVIENVPGAPLLSPVTLCGSEFRLEATDTDGCAVRLERHRLFESNVFLYGAGGCRHDPRVPVAGVYGGGSTDPGHARHVRHGGYTPASKDVRAALLEVDWPMTLHELSQAVPPAYTEHIGGQLLDYLICSGGLGVAA